MTPTSGNGQDLRYAPGSVGSNTSSASIPLTHRDKEQKKSCHSAFSIFWPDIEPAFRAAAIFGCEVKTRFASESSTAGRNTAMPSWRGLRLNSPRLADEL